MQSERKLNDVFNIQKEAYEEMPHASSADQIIGYIAKKEEERKRKKQMWRKVPYTAGLAAVLLSIVLIVSSLEFGNGSSSMSESGRNNEMSSTDSGAEQAESSPLQAKAEKPMSESAALSTIKKMDAAGAPQAEIDGVFLKMLTQKKQLLDFYKSEWQNKYKKMFYTLVGGSEEERLTVLHNIEQLQGDPELQTYVENVYQDGFSFATAGGENGIMPIIDYNELIATFSPHVSGKVIKDLRSEAAPETSGR